MNPSQIENFIKNNAKNPEQAQALRDNLAYKHNPTIRTAFGSFDGYLSWLERPEQSEFKIINDNGVTKIKRNNSRQLSPITEQEINQNWKASPALRCEFPSFQVYRKWFESDVLGRSKIITSQSRMMA
jgi:hypothetical protein